MTQEEIKAQELFNKYYIICMEYTEEIQCSLQAKQCALLAAEECMETNKNIFQATFEKPWINSTGFKYWEKVKEKINKL